VANAPTDFSLSSEIALTKSTSYENDTRRN
jgi:hypothetical protein